MVDAQLRERIRRIERSAATAHQVLPFGIAAIDRALPGSGLARGALHEIMGTGVVMGDTGIIFNCRGDYYSLTPGEANSLEPGKRPRSTLQSTLVMKKGRPYAILGSLGGDDQFARTMQTLINLVAFGMNIQQAIEAPRWSSTAAAVVPFPES